MRINHNSTNGGPASSSRRHRALARELAAFSSAADRLELETMIEAQPADETAEVRAILAAQAA